MTTDANRTLCDECTNAEYDHPADAPTSCPHRGNRTNSDQREDYVMELEARLVKAQVEVGRLREAIGMFLMEWEAAEGVTAQSVRYRNHFRAVLGRE